MLYPLTFHPVYKGRIWGGRSLARLYAKDLPLHELIGESWEITDRPEGISTIATGPLAGKSLRWLMENRLEELLGQAPAQNGRFPLLIKLLDANEALSLQVHPPAPIAARLGGEPKTELWYIAEAKPGAEIFVGLKRGVTREEFESLIARGTVTESVHRVCVRSGDAMFLPGGRLHAIGGGIVIFEIQQNSDTTYRLFDWNRLDSSGKPRDLHIPESLASIDFADFEPGLVTGGFSGGPFRRRQLVADSIFSVAEYAWPAASHLRVENSQMLVIAVVSGKLLIEHKDRPVELDAGRFCLVPASVREFVLRAAMPTRFLQTTAGQCD